MLHYTLKELNNMPTLQKGFTCNLKIEGFHTRIWLSRCSVLDGEPYDNKVTIEQLIRGKWETTTTYQAK